MRTAVTVGACAALLAASAHADAPAPAPPDLGAEIAWARATWPGDFEGVHFHAPLAKLRAWVARGPIPVYLFNDDFACRAATLFPSEPLRNDDAEPGPMTARIVAPPRVEDGRTVREVRYVTVDFELSSEDGSATEARGEGGKWDLTESHGYGIPTIYGALSSVDDRVARWGGYTQGHSTLLQRSGRVAGMRGRRRTPMRPLRERARDGRQPSLRVRLPGRPRESAGHLP